MKKIILWVVAGLVVIAAIAAISNPDSVKEGAQRAIEGASQTAAPTESPTPGPSPTEEPTPDPTIPAGMAGWLSFADHVMGVLPNYLDLMSDFSAAANPPDFAAMQTAGDHLEALANKELAWLADNPPQACYAEVQRDWHDAMEHYRDAGSQVSRGISQLDPDLLQAAVDDMNSGTDLLNRSSDKLADTKC